MERKCSERILNGKFGSDCIIFYGGNEGLQLFSSSRDSCGGGLVLSMFVDFQNNYRKIVLGSAAQIGRAKRFVDRDENAHPLDRQIT